MRRFIRRLFGGRREPILPAWDARAIGAHIALNAPADAQAPEQPQEIVARLRQGLTYEHRIGEALNEQVAPLLAEREDLQGEVDIAASELRAAAKTLDDALSHLRDEREASERAVKAEFHASAGRPRPAGRRIFLPHWLHWAYLGCALPGELAFTAVVFAGYDALIVHLGGHAINLGLLTALTAATTLLVSASLVGILGRAKRHSDIVTRAGFWVALLVAIGLSVGLSMLRVYLAVQTYDRQITALQSLPNTSGNLPTPAEPDQRSIFLMFFGIYLAFVAISALIAALTWDPASVEHRQATRSPERARHRAARRYVNTVADLRGLDGEIDTPWRQAIDQAETGWARIDQEIAEFWAGYDGALAGRVPATVRALRDTWAFPAPAPWRERRPQLQPRVIPPEDLQHLVAGDAHGYVPGSVEPPNDPGTTSIHAEVTAGEEPDDDSPREPTATTSVPGTRCTTAPPRPSDDGGGHVTADQVVTPHANDARQAPLAFQDDDPLGLQDVAR